MPPKGRMILPLMEAGMTTDLENTSENWKAKYTALVPQFLKENDLFLGEDVTAWMRSRGIGEPHHENAWGAMFNSLIAKSDFVIRSGRVRLARSPKSNAHAFRLWKSLLCVGEGKMLSLNQELTAIRSRFLNKSIDLNEALRMAAEAGAEAME